MIQCLYYLYYNSITYSLYSLVACCLYAHIETTNGYVLNLMMANLCVLLFPGTVIVIFTSAP